MRVVIYILLFLVVSNTANSQRLHVGLQGGWNLYTQTKTIMDQQNPLTYIYSAPFSNVERQRIGDDVFESRVSPYNQVRLAKVWGVNSSSSSAVNLGGYVKYAFKNDFSIQLTSGIHHGQNYIFYGFENMVVTPSSLGEVYQGSNSEIFNEDFIAIDYWYNFYQLRFNYQLPIPITTKFSISAGYKFKFQWSSNYNSDVKSFSDSLGGIELNEYNNIYIYQERLYQQHRKPGFNHFAQIGVGVRFHEWSFLLDWFFSPMAQDEKYLNHHYLQLNIQYDLFSIPLFK